VRELGATGKKKTRGMGGSQAKVFLGESKKMGKRYRIGNLS